MAAGDRRHRTGYQHSDPFFIKACGFHSSALSSRRRSDWMALNQTTAGATNPNWIRSVAKPLHTRFGCMSSFPFTVLSVERSFFVPLRMRSTHRA
jgi:hypothetical protein